MSQMSQLAAEKVDEINVLHAEYLEAFSDYMLYQERHPLGHRSVKEMNEMARLESLCAMARHRYETAEERRYRI